MSLLIVCQTQLVILVIIHTKYENIIIIYMIPIQLTERRRREAAIKMKLNQQLRNLKEEVAVSDRCREREISQMIMEEKNPYFSHPTPLRFR